MQLFVLDKDPDTAAWMLDDKRVVKMCLETAQILSTALRLRGIQEPTLYRSTHVSHPIVKWAAESLTNLRWVFKYWLALLREYGIRYNRRHSSANLIVPIERHLISYIGSSAAPTSFANCAACKSKGIDFRHVSDTVKAYNMYLAARWDTDVKAPTLDKESL